MPKYYTTKIRITLLPKGKDGEEEFALYAEAVRGIIFMNKIGYYSGGWYWLELQQVDKSLHEERKPRFWLSLVYMGTVKDAERHLWDELQSRLFFLLKLDRSSMLNLKEEVDYLQDENIELEQELMAARSAIAKHNAHIIRFDAEAALKIGKSHDRSN